MEQYRLVIHGTVRYKFETFILIFLSVKFQLTSFFRRRCDFMWHKVLKCFLSSRVYRLRMSLSFLKLTPRFTTMHDLVVSAPCCGDLDSIGYRILYVKGRCFFYFFTQYKPVDVMTVWNRVTRRRIDVRALHQRKEDVACLSEIWLHIPILRTWKMRKFLYIQLSRSSSSPWKCWKLICAGFFAKVINHLQIQHIVCKFLYHLYIFNSREHSRSR